MLHHLFILSNPLLPKLLQFVLNPFSDPNRTPFPHLDPALFTLKNLFFKSGYLPSVINILFSYISQLSFINFTLFFDHLILVL